MSEPGTRAMSLWNRFWYRSDTPRNLAAMRVIVATHTLWVVLSHDYPGVSAYPEFWTDVSTLERLRYLLFPGHAALESVLQGVAIVALMGAVMGIYPRISCFVAALLVYHLAPLETIIWTPEPLARGSTLAPVLLLILAVSRSGDALALYPRREARPPSSDYGWPRRLGWLLVAQIYLFSAWGKFLQTGVDWGSIENMRLWFLVYWFSDDVRTISDLTLWISGQKWLLGAIGLGIVLFEWAFIAAVFSRLARRVLVPVSLVFQAAVALTLGLFVSESLLVVLFINWDWVLGRLERTR